MLFASLAALPATAATSVLRQVQGDYRSALMAEVCARHAVSAGDSRLRVELRRFRGVIGNADRHGLASALQAKRHDWDHFQKVADWVCVRGASIASFRGAVDRFERSVDAAIRYRGHR